MTSAVTLPAFYRGAINLWVEDVLTRDYLRKVWNDDSAVVFFVGGGKEGITAVLQEAESAGFNNVFAFVDRDFRESNYHRWTDPNSKSKRFVGTLFEVENYLLDSDAMAGSALNTAQLNPAAIHQQLEQRAGELAWWMATRSVIAEARNFIDKDFPSHPKCNQVTDQQSAEAFLDSTPWWNSTRQYFQQLDLPQRITRLNAKFATFTQDLKNRNWLTSFSGKELFRHVRGRVYNKPPVQASSAVYDADFAKAVGEWQAANQRVPQELTDLLNALKARVGT